MTAAPLALVVSLAGCSLGLGSAYVGKHVARRDVAVDACLVDDAGACTEHKQIVRDQPARHFWGAIIGFPALGAAAVTHAGMSETGVRAELSLEVLSGYGRLAWGVRGSAALDDHAIAVPVTAIGHLSLSQRFGVYAGLGYAPWAQLKVEHAPTETAFANARALVGAQVALARVIVLSLEADSLWLGFDQSYHSYGCTGHLGIFF